MEPESPQVLVTILGKRWKLKHVPHLPCELDGDCDPVTAKNRTIRIHESLSGRDHLDTVIHECLHASAFDILKEEYVASAASDIAKVLWRLGYRREE